MKKKMNDAKKQWLGVTFEIETYYLYHLLLSREYRKTLWGHRKSAEKQPKPRFISSLFQRRELEFLINLGNL